jgi:hypothetical protein
MNNLSQLNVEHVAILLLFRFVLFLLQARRSADFRVLQAFRTTELNVLVKLHFKMKFIYLCISFAISQYTILRTQKSHML